jgi:para-nitrobenzyl esterase
MSSRRRFLKNLGVVATAASTNYLIAQQKESAAEVHSTRGEASVRFDSTVPIVQTTHGPIRGYIRNGVHTFKGIPYGSPTSGTNRFRSPQKPQRWTEVLNTVAYGYACQQQHGDDWKNRLSHFVLNFDFGMMSEDCLNLNVWTQSLDKGKRPVLVWIHGGGYQNGSSFEMRCYDGENITRRGDIVFVSVNHRLNALGFLDLSTVGGDDFRTSANVGMLDLMFALEWVRVNIQRFGGDPTNVTICGQSGGGGKVNALMRMPDAKGLFHKAIVQSGSFTNFRNPADSSRVGAQVAKSLRIQGSDLTKLQNLPYDQLMKTSSQAIDDLRKDSASASPIGPFGWAPTADGKVITGNGSNDFSAGIPLLVGYTRNELASSAFDPSVDDLTLDLVKARVEKMQPGGKGTALLAEYQEEYPSAGPAFLYSVVASMMFANSAISQIEERASKSDGAPVFAYRFDWCPDIHDRKLGAFHSLEIGFTFDNTARWDSATGGGERAQSLASRVSQAWIDFARYGDPNHASLPKWPAYNVSEKSVMVFDDACEVRRSPDERAHQILE